MIGQAANSTGGPTLEGGTATAAREKSWSGLSIRSKGLLVFAMLLGYAVLVAMFVFHQKRLLLADFEKIQQTLEVESLLVQADAASFDTVMAIVASVDEGNREAGMLRIREQLRVLQQRHAVLQAHIPAFSNELIIEHVLDDAGVSPSREKLQQLIDEVVKIKSRFASQAEHTAQERRRMSENYRARTDAVAMTTLLLSILGVAILGAIMGFFFRRLTTDLSTLQERALDIVNGYRGTPMPVTRKDEVGRLMNAVNSMAFALDKRDKELILERQKYFHQEKMAAIGALAAGVAHEIGNPIAAISGIAQEMSERRSESLGTCQAGCCEPCRPDLIQAQAERLAVITREISEFASPQPAEPQLLDLNAQLRSTSSLIRYDKRLRRVELRLDLDHHLPAIHGMADQLTQLIMNLLINAMDALEPVMDRLPKITLSTRFDEQRVCMTVEDNGPGMEKEVLDRAFEAFFTTKPAGKGTGLGLSLCYSIMKNHGGSIDIDSTPGQGTRVQVFFPLAET